MHKKIILLSICSLLALNAQTQGFKGGGQIGVLATQVDGDNHSGYKKAGLFAGIFTNYSFANEKIQLQFEINYAQKGSRAAPVYRMKLHQVEPTAMFRWYFWEKNLFLETGLSFNILAASKEYYYDELLVTENTKSKFYRFNVEWVGGIGYCFHEHWGGGLRFTYSSPIGTTNKMNSKVGGVKGYMCNNCLQFRVFYQF
jgi:hypothetical protein